MFEFLVEKEIDKRKLSDDQAEKVAGDIGDLWSRWDSARSKQKQIADALRPEIYLDEREVKDRGEDNWKSDVHLNKIYSLVQTQQAFIWDNIYSSVDKLFDVEGRDEVSHENAKAQKDNLVNIFYSIGIQRKLDRAIEYLLSTGEFCLFVCWKTIYKQVRRRMSAYGGETSALFRGENYGVFNRLVYSGAVG